MASTEEYVFLYLIKQGDLVTLGLGIAESLVDEQGIIEWIKRHARDK